LAGPENRDLAELEAGLGVDRFTQPRKILVVHVHDGSALLTHKMVMGDFFLDLEEAAPWAQMGLSHQAELHEQLKGAIDGGQIHMGESLLDPSADLLRAQVTFLTAKHVPYQRALRSQSVALLLKSACGVVSHS
jgi:hypothetical protein